MKDLSMAYAMKKKLAQKFAKGGIVEEEKESGFEPMPEDDGTEDQDIVDRVMKRMAAGGMVTADSMPNEFDELKLSHPDEISYTGDNSGDHVGNSQLDEDNDDIIARVMRSLAKKDVLPKVR